MGLMLPCRRSRCVFLPALAILCVLSLAGLAQSPTADIIRIQTARFGASQPRIVEARSQLTSRGGFVRSRVTVIAPTRRLAHRFAVRHAYARAYRVVTVPLRRWEATLDSLAAATSELKAVEAHVLSEKQTPAGYTMEVEVNQSASSLTQDIRSNGLSNYRLVALLPERIDGVRVASPQVETALVGALADQHFQVYDWNFVATQKPLVNLVSATLSEQPEAASQLGTQFLANTIVAGHVDARYSQNNDGILSYVAVANLRVIRVDTGQVLFAHEYAEKGFGQDKPQAARQALSNLAETVSKELPAELSGHTEQYPITVQLAAADAQPADQVAEYLRGLPGVTDVKQTQTSDGTTFRVLSHEKPAVLGGWIERDPNYHIVDFGQGDNP